MASGGRVMRSHSPILMSGRGVKAMDDIDIDFTDCDGGGGY